MNTCLHTNIPGWWQIPRAGDVLGSESGGGAGGVDGVYLLPAVRQCTPHGSIRVTFSALITNIRS